MFLISGMARRSTRKYGKRKTARRAYTGLRRRTRRRTSRRKTNSPKSMGSKIYSLVKSASPYIAFTSQLTQKDYSALENTSYKNENMATKAKIFANIVTGRLTGFTAFKNGNLYGSETTPFTINPSGVANKVTGIGVAGLIYKNLPIKQLPQKQKVGEIAKRVLLGGALGGLFDAPDNTSMSQTASSSPQVLGKHMSVIQQNRSASMQRGMYSEGNDSTEGSFN